MVDYDVTITDGRGCARIKEGCYTVTVDACGYENCSLEPKTFTVPSTGCTQAFTVSACGTLTFCVNETGAAGGTPITCGQIVMTNAMGNKQYGEPVEIGTDGTAVFQNVPFGIGTDPYMLYFRQLSSDRAHEIQEGIITVPMKSSKQKKFIRNVPVAKSCFTLESADYAGLPVTKATLTFTEKA